MKEGLGQRTDSPAVASVWRCVATVLLDAIQCAQDLHVCIDLECTCKKGIRVSLIKIQLITVDEATQNYSGVIDWQFGQLCPKTEKLQGQTRSRTCLTLISIIRHIPCPAK